ncbi:MAG: hypothetical protein IMZ60_00145 [Actinobacteria bacterium]|nr:hypothetical protein [Actinomycetota bacterium]
MITKEDIEIERTPNELRQFVTTLKSKIDNCEQERHRGMQKKGIYKVFVDEIIPLSLFCIKIYPDNYKILPKLGNQGYDAIVKDENGKIFEYVEITAPHDGRKAANVAKLAVKNGIALNTLRDYNSGSDLIDMFSIIMDVCEKKSKKDYSNCSLVIDIDFSPPFEEEKTKYAQLVKELEKKILKMKFNVKKIYLLIIPLEMVKKIYG